ncbi:hypothetical protein CUMW_195500 [Citrus unshiu]|uniref:Uncharacterized protein n=1 Tax=Citrus unshiu TaxID=55188 RepID=A0A2H5Q4L5_CITUN|nr:hypothetical protein CUMW_195500 [Citrus unshiu]
MFVPKSFHITVLIFTEFTCEAKKHGHTSIDAKIEVGEDRLAPKSLIYDVQGTYFMGSESIYSATEEAEVKMDDSDGTTIVCTFNGKTHNLGVIDRDKFNRVSLINKVLDYKKVEIMSDHDLIFQLREHNKMLLYYMQLYIEEIHSPHEFVPIRALFQHSEGSLEPNPETNFPAITDLNKPNTHAPTTNTDPSENDTNGHSKYEAPVKNTSNIMMYMVAPDSIQLQTKPHSQVVQGENFQQPKATTPVLVDYNSDDSHYSVTDSDEDPNHPLGAPNINNTLEKYSVNVDLGCMPSDNSDGDCMLSDCESDDNEFEE